MIYRLGFDERAEKEFRKLGSTIREQFKKKLRQRIQNPHVPSARLRDMPGCYKIKLRKAGYRLIYKVVDEQLLVFVIGLDKREGGKVYTTTKKRL